MFVLVAHRVGPVHPLDSQVQHADAVLVVSLPYRYDVPGGSGGHLSAPPTVAARTRHRLAAEMRSGGCGAPRWKLSYLPPRLLPTRCRALSGVVLLLVVLWRRDDGCCSVPTIGRCTCGAAPASAHPPVIHRVVSGGWRGGDADCRSARGRPTRRDLPAAGQAGLHPRGTGRGVLHRHLVGAATRRALGVDRRAVARPAIRARGADR